jgi:hypothetical protein
VLDARVYLTLRRYCILCEAEFLGASRPLCPRSTWSQLVGDMCRPPHSAMDDPEPCRRAGKPCITLQSASRCVPQRQGSIRCRAGSTRAHLSTPPAPSFRGNWHFTSACPPAAGSCHGCSSGPLLAVLIGPCRGGVRLPSLETTRVLGREGSCHHWSDEFLRLSQLRPISCRPAITHPEGILTPPASPRAVSSPLCSRPTSFAITSLIFDNSSTVVASCATRSYNIPASAPRDSLNQWWLQSRSSSLTPYPVSA